MKKKIIVAAVSVALVFVIVANFIFSQTADEVFLAMNTTVSFNIAGYKPDKTAQTIKDEITRLDVNLLSRTNTSSELYAVNNGKTQVSDELAELLTNLKQIEIDSDGAFCVGLGALSDLWGIGTDNARIPSQAEIDAAIRNARNWSINGNTVYLPEGVKLDMGAVGKGYACDSVMGIVYGTNHIKTVTSVGGSVLVYSSNPKETFTIGVRNPSDQVLSTCISLKATSSCISTSGTYERFFEDENGKRYHHIFDPSTGYPADSGLASVTVISSQGYVSDALSTACFVLGIEKSLPLLEKYNADAIFITADKEIITTYGEEQNKILTVTNNEYKLGELK